MSLKVLETVFEIIFGLTFLYGTTECLCIFGFEYIIHKDVSFFA